MAKKIDTSKMKAKVVKPNPSDTPLHNTGNLSSSIKPVQSVGGGSSSGGCGTPTGDPLYDILHRRGGKKEILQASKAKVEAIKKVNIKK